MTFIAVIAIAVLAVIGVAGSFSVMAQEYLEDAGANDGLSDSCPAGNYLRTVSEQSSKLICLLIRLTKSCPVKMSTDN